MFQKMEFKYFKLVYLVVYQLNMFGHCLSSMEEESVVSATPTELNSTLGFTLKTQDEVESGRSGMEGASNREPFQIDNSFTKKGAIGQTINLFKNICFSDIVYDMCDGLIPSKRIENSPKPQIINKKKGDKKVSIKKVFSEVAEHGNISHIHVRTSLTKLKLKHASLLNGTNKNRLSSVIQESTIKKQESTLNFSDSKINVDKPESNDSKIIKGNVENSFVHNDTLPGLHFVQIDDVNNVSIIRGRGFETCSRSACRYLNRDSNLKLKKRGFKHESSNKNFGDSNSTNNVSGSTEIGPRNMNTGSLNEEEYVPNDKYEAEKGTTCPNNVCSLSKSSKLRRKKQLSKEAQTFNDSLTMINTEVVEEGISQNEINMKELKENIEGITYVLHERHHTLNKEQLTYDSLLKNISSLIEKLDLLKERIEMENVTRIENHILNPDEEALITESALKLYEAERRYNKTEEWPREEERRNMNHEKYKYFFSSGWGLCAVCITVANKLNEAFNTILQSLEFKDLPPASLNLGDDWCANFRNSPRLILNEFQRNLPNLFNGEKIDAQFHLDLENEFIEKCNLYRSLIPDVQLYRHWLNNNNDMTKTLCKNDYTVEFKSCAPFLL